MRIPAGGRQVENKKGAAPGGFPKPQQRGQQSSDSKEPKDQRKEKARQLLKDKADKVAQKDKPRMSSQKEEGNTKRVVESKAPVKEKKEAVLAGARKKMGMSEEKRAEFKDRAKKSNVRRQGKRKEAEQQVTTPAATDTTTVGDATLGRLKRKDMDPNRSIMAQRVEHQMKKTGMTREDAKSTVLARRKARQMQIADVQSQYDIGARQARNIVQYANQNKVAGTEGQPAVANYQLAQRVVQMAKNKGLSRNEAAGVIASRREKRQVAAAPAQTSIL